MNETLFTIYSTFASPADKLAGTTVAIPPRYMRLRDSALAARFFSALRYVVGAQF